VVAGAEPVVAEGAERVAAKGTEPAPAPPAAPAKPPCKRFDNQATLVLKISPEPYFINMKVFRNGNVQMTGIKRIEDGVKAVDVFFSARVFLFRKADMARAASDETYLEGWNGAAETLEAEERASDAELASIPEHLPWQRRLGGGAWFALIVITVNITAVLLSPVFTDHTYVTLFQSLGAKLHPWPG
jgi:hypothetical protein